MKVAQHDHGEIRIEEVATPAPGPDEALVRISTAGVCHSDLHLVRGDWEYTARTGPIGHEAIGVVEALGPGAERFAAVGDRVILGLGGMGGGDWCGACESCLRGSTQTCTQAVGIMGVFAEYYVTLAKGLVVLPDSVGDHEAPLACGGLTAYGAVRKLAKFGVRPGQPVAVIGAAGGLGHYAVQIANEFGYRVLGVDVGADRLAFVESLGAELAVEPLEAVEVAQREFGGVAACLVFSARMAGFQLGFQVLRRSGLFVAVALLPSSEGKLEIDPFQMFIRDPTIVYSAVGNVQDMRDVVDLVARGKLRSHIGRTGGLADLADVFDDLEASRYLGRAVIEIGG
ncbi:MAG: alcohol dehydrogenase catalytic domain-containing protein [Actinomycetes bacterium]